MREQNENSFDEVIDFERFFTNSLDLLCIANTAGYFVRLNPAWETVLGYSLNTLLATPYLDFVHPDDIEATLGAMEQLRNNSDVIRFENRFRRSDGEYRYIEWSTKTEGEYLYAAARDVTLRKQTEEALREKEYFLRKSQEVAQIGSYVLDFSSGFWSASEMLQEIFGIGTDYDQSIEGWLQIVHPDDKETMRDYFENEVCGRQCPFDHIYRVVRPSDGEVRWIHGLGELTFSDGGAPVTMLGTVQDVTDQRRAELELEEREQFLTTVFETSGDAIFIIDSSGHVKKANSRACSLYGYRADEFAHMHITEIYADETLESVPARIKEIRETGAIQFETKHKTRDGVILTVEVYSSWLELQGGVYVSFSRDITEKAKIFEKLRRSEGLIRRISDNLAGGMVYQLDSGVHGEMRKFTYISSGVTRFHGLTPEEALADPFTVYRQLHPEDAIILALLEEEAIAEMKTFRAESRIINHRGEMRWSLFLSEPHRNEQNHLLFDGIELDITAQKEAEIKLTQSKERYERLIEGLGDQHAVFSHTAEGVFLYVSCGFENLFGVSAVEIVGKDWRELNLTEESLEAGNRSDEIILRERIRQTVELTSTHRDGSVHIIEVNYGPVVENDTVVRMEGICTDITETRRNEELLRREKERLAEAQRIAHIGNWELNHETDELHWSDEIYNMFEVDRNLFRATYEGFLDVIHPDDREMVDQIFTHSLRSREHYDVQHRLLLTGGRIKYVHERCRTTFDSDGNPLISIGTVQDITALKLAEDERKQLQDQLYQSQKMEAVGQLAGGVAHDFNNMLGVILGHTEELLTDITRENSLYESILELKEAAERSADLTRQLLAFSRQEAIAPQYLDLNKTIKGMLNMLKRLIGENIRIHWKPAAGDASVFMDPGQIDQILANLCVNARDAIGDTGDVTIKTDVILADIPFCQKHSIVPGNYVLVSVIDSGSGMDEDTRVKIFEPFFTTKEVGKGTGLGLSTVYGIVQQNGGIIEVESAPGKGTAITIYIPYQISLAPSAPLTVEKPAESELTGDETILLVEDEKMLLSTLTKLLKRNGYHVIGTESPEEALELADQHRGKIDLLVTDVIMPGLNGRELAGALKENNHNLKMLYMSGYTSTVITDHGVLNEGVNFIQKPFRFDDLLLKVKQSLSK